MKVLVTGAGGFLGGYLVARLLEQGHDVLAVSRRPPERWAQWHRAAVCRQANLDDAGDCYLAVPGIERIYHLAAAIGGIGFIESHHADCAGSVVSSANLLRAAARADVRRFLFPSSACVYPDTGAADAPPLLEADVQPYAPRGGYGWQKLFTEQMCGFFAQQYGLEVRIARLGTVYGPLSPIGAHEKAPIAICRKVIEAMRDGHDSIEIWGDGEQTRSFLFVTDAITALLALMDSDVDVPVNVDSAERVSINRLVDLVLEMAGPTVRLGRRYLPDRPQGVRGRICDTVLARHALGWREHTTLAQGLEMTFLWLVGALEREAVVA